MIQTADTLEALRIIKKSVKVILIITGDLGKQFIKTIYNGLDPVENIDSIVNYCGNIEVNQKYFENYDMVNNFVNEPDALDAMVNKLAHDAFGKFK